jgi:hypothetical protein
VHLPVQYQVCLTALDEIIKRAFEILETSEDNREKLQAMELFKDTHLVKLELLSNATTIDSALTSIRSKQQQSKKHLTLDSTDGDDNIDDSGNSQLSKEGRQTQKEYFGKVLFNSEALQSIQSSEFEPRISYEINKEDGGTISFNFGDLLSNVPVFERLKWKQFYKEIRITADLPINEAYKLLNLT